MKLVQKLKTYKKYHVRLCYVTTTHQKNQGPDELLRQTTTTNR